MDRKSVSPDWWTLACLEFEPSTHIDSGGSPWWTHKGAGTALASSFLAPTRPHFRAPGAAVTLNKPLTAVPGAFVSPGQGFMKWIWCTTARVVHPCVLAPCPGRWQGSRLALAPQLSLLTIVTQSINKLIHSLSFLSKPNTAKRCYQGHPEQLERPFG